MGNQTGESKVGGKLGKNQTRPKNRNGAGNWPPRPKKIPRRQIPEGTGNRRLVPRNHQGRNTTTPPTAKPGNLPGGQGPTETPRGAAKKNLGEPLGKTRPFPLWENPRENLGRVETQPPGERPLGSGKAFPRAPENFWGPNFPPNSGGPGG